QSRLFHGSRETVREEVRCGPDLRSTSAGCHSLVERPRRGFHRGLTPPLAPTRSASSAGNMLRRVPSQGTARETHPCVWHARSHGPIMYQGESASLPGPPPANIHPFPRGSHSDVQPVGTNTVRPSRPDCPLYALLAVRWVDPG